MRSDENWGCGSNGDASSSTLAQTYKRLLTRRVKIWDVCAWCIVDSARRAFRRPHACGWVCVSTWPNLCTQQPVSQPQTHGFLYYSQLCGLGSLVFHAAAGNVWCVALLESPSYPHKHTCSHTPWNKPSPLSRQREGLTPKEEWFKFLSW